MPRQREEDATPSSALRTIWSLGRRAEVLVRIYYRVQEPGPCRIFRLERIEELGE